MAEISREPEERSASLIWQNLRKHLGMDKIFLILLAGVLLLLSAGPSKKQTESGSGTTEDLAGGSLEETVPGTDQSRTGGAGYAAQMEGRLEAALLAVEGVGKVKVMITLKNTGEKQLQSNLTREHSATGETDSAGGSRNIQEGKEEYAAMILSDGIKESPYVTKEMFPEIEGVLVVAQGAGNSSVKTEIYEAVQALFSVPAHKIKVLKGVLEN